MHSKLIFVLSIVALLVLAGCETSPRRQLLAAHESYQGAAEAAEVLIDYDVVDAEDVLPAARKGRQILQAWGEALAAWEGQDPDVRPSKPPVEGMRERLREQLRDMNAALNTD